MHRDNQPFSDLHVPHYQLHHEANRSPIMIVVFGDFSPFQKADSHEPSGIKSPTVVTHAKIPHASHMTPAIFHHVTLY